MTRLATVTIPADRKSGKGGKGAYWKGIAAGAKWKKGGGENGRDWKGREAAGAKGKEGVGGV